MLRLSVPFSFIFSFFISASDKHDAIMMLLLKPDVQIIQISVNSPTNHSNLESKSQQPVHTEHAVCVIPLVLFSWTPTHYFPQVYLPLFKPCLIICKRLVPCPNMAFQHIRWAHYIWICEEIFPALCFAFAETQTGFFLDWKTKRCLKRPFLWNNSFEAPGIPFGKCMKYERWKWSWCVERTVMVWCLI